MSLYTLVFGVFGCQPTTASDDGADESGQTEESEDSTDGECMPGTADCVCLDSLCFVGLECVAGVCADTTGDGDGDPTGDGDGDPTGDGDGDGTCGELGCDCDGAPDSCDPELVCDGGSCAQTVCGDGLVQGLEQCDDANNQQNDGCEADCTNTEVIAIVAATSSTYALMPNGKVIAWGRNSIGLLGQGNTLDIGDDELPWFGVPIEFEIPITEISAGRDHMFVKLQDGGLRCWGQTFNGPCGYGYTTLIGDNELLDVLIDVPLDDFTQQVRPGHSATCAIMLGGLVRCWGQNTAYQKLGLGLPAATKIGDDELPTAVGHLAFSGPVTTLGFGSTTSHGCALIDDGNLQCWGRNDNGELGYGHTNVLETPGPPFAPIAQSLPLDTQIVDVGTGAYGTCVLYDTGDVLCWGNNVGGFAGQGMTDNIGDNELPSAFPPIDLGGAAVSIEVGFGRVCAVLEGQGLKCWGVASNGALGQGAEDESIGDDETPAAVPVLDLPAGVSQVAMGQSYVCALLVTNEIYCWGSNNYGQLGLGHTNNVLIAAEGGPVELF
ncbi:hypothetical protein DB30_07033 [Enhygromyxa salina]|uniref:Regulator of chromosome condensation (RCC1) repeat protein n=1 Tax=Enhygromyxa salina TaxID=215803 RepID=A0A0C2CX24_9BACT|nr:hypothetical protein DB30_07033 [Enhygromyxa salina]